MDCIAQVAADGTDESDESEFSGDCIGEGFFQEETSEDEEIDDLTFSALTLETMVLCS